MSGIRGRLAKLEQRKTDHIPVHERKVGPLAREIREIDRNIRNLERRIAEEKRQKDAEGGGG